MKMALRQKKINIHELNQKTNGKEKFKINIYFAHSTNRIDSQTMSQWSYHLSQSKTRQDSEPNIK